MVTTTSLLARRAEKGLQVLEATTLPSVTRVIRMGFPPPPRLGTMGLVRIHIEVVLDAPLAAPSCGAPRTTTL